MNGTLLPSATVVPERNYKRVSRILSGGGMYSCMHWGRHPPAVIPVCTGVDTRGRYPSMHWGRYPLGRYPSMHWGRHPLGRYPSMHLGRHTPAAGRPPPNGHCSGRYASYWNAFLFYECMLIGGTLKPTVQICLNFFTQRQWGCWKIIFMPTHAPGIGWRPKNQTFTIFTYSSGDTIPPSQLGTRYD